MCLDTVSKVYKKPQRGVKRGYKVFPIVRGKPTPEIFGDILYYDVNEWYESYVDGDCPEYGYTGMDEEYPLGFHIFETKAGAKRWGGGTVYLVEYDRMIVEGIQHSGSWGTSKCVVALDMRIIKPA